jgi:hypothetical protein
MLIRAVLAASCSAALLAGTAHGADPVKPAPAKPAAKAAAAPVPYHHKGLRGQATPHNGWAAYTHLTLDIGTDRYFVYDQSAGEFSATVIDRQSEAIKLRGISIPGAGLFYYPAEASPCAPDALERLGLYAELLLFYMSSAFPAGPTSIDATSSGTVDRAIPELRFMDGLMKPHEGSRTLITATPVAQGGGIQYLLQDEKDKIKGLWQSTPGRPIIPDDEPLLDWKVCWAGSWASRPDGGSSFKPRLANASTLKTFGDVRKALRARDRNKAAK